MSKRQTDPKWIDNLRFLMENRQFNPRSLSLAAGLNATAVRDMLEGRAKFPRYDTVEALAKALEVTPAQLMGSTPEALTGHLENLEKRENSHTSSTDPLADDDLNLLTEIITRLQEAAQTYRQSLSPQDFAAMVTSLYRQIGPAAEQGKPSKKELTTQIDALLSYQTLRTRVGGK